ncbi:NUDIX domain-containing protein [Aliamphritea ceti]|uniref:NUDIX domain-containing protein n=1 Tax=Aliamphritea ceti TaxID=1524258 RepID=UPI0021C3F998|nr:NUDIX domain-containing protein [Aliamphritea ceti]
MSWHPGFSRDDVEIVTNKTVYSGFFKVSELEIRHARFAGGSIDIRRELLHRGDAVCVLLFDPAMNAVVLIEQFRIGAVDKSPSPWLLELIAGMVEPGETAQDVARREAVEEAGAIIHDLMPITRYSPSVGGCDEYVDLFCARVDASNLGGLHGLEAEGEDIKVHVLPLCEAFELVVNGQIDNAGTIIALQWLQLNKETVLQRWS